MAALALVLPGALAYLPAVAADGPQAPCPANAEEAALLFFGSSIVAPRTNAQVIEPGNLHDYRLRLEQVLDERYRDVP